MKNLCYAFLIISLVNCNNFGKDPSAKQVRSPNEKACIERILALDDSLGSIRNEATKKLPISQSIKQYAAALKDLDFESCPPTFTEAFKNHRKAWEEMLTVTDKYPEMRGELHQVFEHIGVSEDSVEFKTRLDRIWSTWEVVEEQSKP